MVFAGDGFFILLITTMTVLTNKFDIFVNAFVIVIVLPERVQFAPVTVCESIVTLLHE